MRSILLLLLFSSVASSAEPVVTRNINYAGTNNVRQTLDVYAAKDGKQQPVVIWLHGGGWRRGNKILVQQKPQAFVDQGYVFVSINYRFTPEFTMSDLATDVATAVKWVTENIESHGGSPEIIFIGGHSAGAHLSALVSTDERYLKAQGLSLGTLKGCFPVDTATYDCAKLVSGLKLLRSNRVSLYTNAFGEETASQQKYSPITHLQKGTDYPDFLLLFCESRRDATLAANHFAKAIQQVGGTAETYAAPGKDHASINNDLGTEGDETTNVLFAFLNKRIEAAKEPGDVNSPK